MVRYGFVLLMLGMVFGIGSAQRARTGEVDGRSVSPNLFQRTEHARPAKSPLAAIGLSIILPGLGEWYAGNFQTGRYFLAADGALWLAYGSVSLQGSWIREDARSFAQMHAQADFAGKDEQFDVNIGNFNATDDYNQAKLRNREFDLLYSGTTYDWRWDNDVHRVHYRSLRIRSDELFQASRFVIGALVVNRIISAFSAWRSAANFNKDSRFETGWSFESRIPGDGYGHGFGLKITRRF